jgi:hypothetical protein
MKKPIIKFSDLPEQERLKLQTILNRNKVKIPLPTLLKLNTTISKKDFENWLQNHLN